MRIDKNYKIYNMVPTIFSLGIKSTPAMLMNHHIEITCKLPQDPCLSS